MTNLSEQIEAAEAHLEWLKRQAKVTKCAEIGAHDWVHIGGRNAGCHRDCSCSVPVHECSRCGDCDYGINEEASDVIRCCGEFET
jgi:hypothetical protein